jgi:hypothetical protein
MTGADSQRPCLRTARSAFGFGITFYPTVAVYLWLILYMVFGIHVKL